MNIIFLIKKFFFSTLTTIVLNFFFFLSLKASFFGSLEILQKNNRELDYYYLDVLKAYQNRQKSFINFFPVLSLSGKIRFNKLRLANTSIFSALLADMKEISRRVYIKYHSKCFWKTDSFFLPDCINKDQIKNLGGDLIRDIPFLVENTSLLLEKFDILFSTLPFEINFNISQNIFLGGIGYFTKKIQDSLLNIELLKFRKKSQEVLLKAVETYLENIKLNKSIKVIKKKIFYFSQIHEKLKKFFARGFISLLDLEKFVLEFDKLKHRLLVLKSELETNRERFKMLFSFYPDNLVLLDKRFFSFIESVGTKNLFKKNIDLALIKERLKMGVYLSKNYLGGSFFLISLFFNFRLETDLGVFTNFLKIKYRPHWFLGLEIKWPIMKLEEVLSSVLNEKIEKEKNQLSFSHSRKRIKEGFLTLRKEYFFLKQSLGILEKEIQVAQKIVKLNLAKFENGLIKLEELIKQVNKKTDLDLEKIFRQKALFMISLQIASNLGILDFNGLKDFLIEDSKDK